MSAAAMIAVLALLSVSGLLLFAAGISALMSFTVVRRRREIGIATDTLAAWTPARRGLRIQPTEALRAD